MHQFLNRYIPSHFQDPIGLAKRLVTHENRAARYALGLAAAGVAAAPLDLLLSIGEKKRLRSPPDSDLPTILICGPPRSGTTLVYQALLQSLPLAYFNNLTALFPRSPLTASRLFERFLSTRNKDCNSFYGRTQNLSGPNDALYLWDRWFGTDRTRTPQSLSAANREEMRRFFLASLAHWTRPLVCKNNSLNATAHLVAEALENSVFICLTRQPLFLAQSLYEARLTIHGSLDRPYGLTSEQSRAATDPLRSICAQVKYYQELAQLQVERLGKDRYWNVSYEQFCADPTALVRRVAQEILGLDEHDANQLQVPAYQTANRQRLAPPIFKQLQRHWEEIGTHETAAQSVVQPS